MKKYGGDSKGGVATLEPPAGATFDFEATDVTGTHTLRAEKVQRTLPAGAVANALANRMSLPTNVPWALRDDTTSAFLDDALAIGDQIGPDARVTLTPTTRLPGPRWRTRAQASSVLPASRLAAPTRTIWGRARRRALIPPPATSGRGRPRDPPRA